MKSKQLFALGMILCLILAAGCSSNSGDLEEAWVLEEEKAITFFDGESADLWRNDRYTYTSYRLSDGTILLTFKDTIGPENVFVGGVESYADLNESAQKAVSSYYDDRGLLYDTRSELEQAYNEYLACKESGIEYNDLYISQDTIPTASNESIICFMTSVALPMNGQTGQEIRLGAVFDRKTGEVISNWDLFAIPETEARQWLIDAFDITDPTLRAEMEEAMKPEYIILFPQNLEVTFPQGTLKSQENSYSLSLEYSELQNVLHPWSIPDNAG